jgi:hypothetical protein
MVFEELPTSLRIHIPFARGASLVARPTRVCPALFVTNMTKKLGTSPGEEVP